jgi:hypothetical protein
MNPCKRRNFIRKLKNLGFEGPFSVAKYEFMLIGNYRLAVPSNDEYSIPQLIMMQKEVQGILNRNIENEEWEIL